MRKALYRKYRPTKLSEVIGQNQVTDILKKSLDSNNFSHAYIFIGPRGCGKTSVARIFAHEVNNFKYEIEDEYVDIIEIDAASNTGVDNIRELREKALVAPTKGKYKVYIIDEVHMLSKSAFNALLKTLEEPPKHVIFIMATTDAYKIPATITSRAQTFTFKLSDEKTMLEHLKNICKKEKIKADDGALKAIIKHGGGSFRDTLSILDQISTLSDDTITEKLVSDSLGLPNESKIDNLLESYESNNFSNSTEILKNLIREGAKPDVIVEELIEHIILNPTQNSLCLLSKLSNIKAPHIEAKLLVALYKDEVPISKIKQQPVEQVKKQKMEQTEQIIEEKTEIKRISNVDFEWNSFVKKVRELNDAIATQLSKTSYEFDGKTLDIYPKKKVIKAILSRDNNKRILTEALDGIKIKIHEADEIPQNSVKDANISQISAIMGVAEEVQIENGGNPF